jgi:Mn-dependent DtxR family transcriptional regulator
LWKELRLASFDPALARTLGFDASMLLQVVMVLTAATCVACFEAVGSIMTVTFIVAPAATALLLSRRLGVVTILAVVVGGVAAVVGHVSAITVPGWLLGDGFDTSSSGMMAVASFALFVVAVLLAPHRGLVARRFALRRLAATVAIEDALGLIYRLEERPGVNDAGMVHRLLEGDVRVGHRRVDRVLAALRKRGLAILEAGRWTLTEDGRTEAAGMVRAHRLWETYLASQSDMPASHLHGAAERLEHVTDAVLARELTEATDSAAVDPHGRDIPQLPQDAS